MTPPRFPWVRFAFVGVLLLVGVGFLALSAYRAWHPRSKPATEADLAAKAEADLEKRGFRELSEPLQKLLDTSDYKPVPTQSPPLLGEDAPDFTLDDTTGKP